MAKSSLWVFPNENTLQPYFESRPIVKSYFKPLLERLNIPYKTLYATRHSFASSIVEKNMPNHFGSEVFGAYKAFYYDGLLCEEWTHGCCKD